MIICFWTFIVFCCHSRTKSSLSLFVMNENDETWITKNIHKQRFGSQYFMKWQLMKTKCVNLIIWTIILINHIFLIRVYNWLNNRINNESLIWFNLIIIFHLTNIFFFIFVSNASRVLVFFETLMSSESNKIVQYWFFYSFLFKNDARKTKWKENWDFKFW